VHQPERLVVIVAVGAVGERGLDLRHGRPGPDVKRKRVAGQEGDQIRAIHRVRGVESLEGNAHEDTLAATTPVLGALGSHRRLTTSRRSPGM
jgi:hypothetical protein